MRICFKIRTLCRVKGRITTRRWAKIRFTSTFSSNKIKCNSTNNKITLHTRCSKTEKVFTSIRMAFRWTLFKHRPSKLCSKSQWVSRGMRLDCIIRMGILRQLRVRGSNSTDNNRNKSSQSKKELPCFLKNLKPLKMLLQPKKWTDHQVEMQDSSNKTSYNSNKWICSKNNTLKVQTK